MSAGGEWRRLAAIVSADAAGYSRLMGNDEVSTLTALRAHRSEVIDPVIATHRGRIFKTTGDGVLAEFASVVDAAQCIVEMQRRLQGRNDAMPAEQRLQFRMGLHLGDVILDGDDVFGDGVNIAARLQAIAPAGGACLSDEAARQVRGKLGVELRRLGTQRLRSIAEPVVTWCWHPDAVRMYDFTSDATLDDRSAVAVLPFLNLTSTDEGDYFADGLTEDIITQLSRVSGLHITARSSAFAWKGRTVGAREIGRELGVRYLVEGSVRRADNRVRVTAQLVDAESGKQLWAERYDRDVSDIFQLQDDVTAPLSGLCLAGWKQPIWCASRASFRPTWRPTTVCCAARSIITAVPAKTICTRWTHWSGRSRSIPASPQPMHGKAALLGRR